MSWAFENFDFDGITILVRSNDIGYNKCVFFSGFEIIKFSTKDKILDFKSLMGHNLTPTAFAVGEKDTFSLSDR